MLERQIECMDNETLLDSYAKCVIEVEEEFTLKAIVARDAIYEEIMKRMNAKEEQND